MQVQHRGSDGGLLYYVTLEDSFGTRNHLYNCRIGVKLDHSEEKTVTCRREAVDLGGNLPCNGNRAFCRRRFDDFTFPGSHNAGTGQSDYRLLACASKNQDLDVSGQLDFGIRFFDFDVIYSHSAPFCGGLETGHGKYPDAGIYQCFGLLDNLFGQVRDWLADHLREVVVLYFGELQYEADTYPRLAQVT